MNCSLFRSFLLVFTLPFFWGSLCIGSTISVTNANDSGTGSLRQAILDANGDSSINTVDLTSLQSSGGSEPVVILLESPLSVGSNPLNIIASSEYPRPILEAKDNDHRLITISSTSSGVFEFRFLHFRNGRQSSTSSASHGGAIYYSQISGNWMNLKVIDCYFENNTVGVDTHSSSTSGNGGAIYFKTSLESSPPPYLEVVECYFVGNRALRSEFGNAFGSAVYVENADFMLRGSQFISNTGNASGGSGGTLVYLGGTANVFIRDCAFTSNENGVGASGILVRNFLPAQSRGPLTVHINRTRFDGNGSSSSGPVINSGTTSDSVEPVTVNMTNCLFTLNQGFPHSVALSGSRSSLNFIHCTIVNNWHYNTLGSALRGNSSTSEILIEKSVLAENIYVGGTQNSGVSPNIWLTSDAVLESGGYNFISTIAGLDSDLFDEDTDQFSLSNNDPIDPLLGTYRDYGDGIFILPPLAGGPLTEKIPGPYPTFGNLASDVRNYERHLWGSADIGAVQLRRSSYDNWASSELFDLPEGDDRLPDADYSGDGLSNRMSYFLGLDPTVFNPNPVSVVPASENLFLEFVRHKGAGFDPAADNGISNWAVEYSDDLETWLPFVGDPTISSVDPTSVEYVRYRYTVDPTEADRRFFRLQVE